MAGHSKWHNIQHKKGKADKARSSLFTKLLRYIVVAAQQGGGDPDMWYRIYNHVKKYTVTQSLRCIAYNHRCDNVNKRR